MAFLALMAVMVAVMVAVSLPRGEPALAQDAGICGRTQQVREAILAKLDGVSGCLDVTAEDLAGITGRLSTGECRPFKLNILRFRRTFQIDSAIHKQHRGRKPS